MSRRATPLLGALGAVAVLAGCRGPAISETAAAPPVDAVTPGEVAWLDAGPMIGHVSDREARVWFRPAPGIEVLAEAAQDGRPVAARVEPVGGRCQVVHLEELGPDAPVVVTLRDAASAGAPVEVRSRTAPPPSRTGTVRLAFGSCVNDGEHGPVPVLGAAAPSGRTSSCSSATTATS